MRSPAGEGGGIKDLILNTMIAALKKLTEEGSIIREGSGMNTFYVRADSK